MSNRVSRRRILAGRFPLVADMAVFMESSMLVKRLSTQGLVLDKSKGFWRAPKYYEGDYLADDNMIRNYDSDTLCFDAFFAYDGKSVIMLCPAFWNLSRYMYEARYCLSNSKNPESIRFTAEPYFVTQDHVSLIRLPCPNQFIDTVTIVCAMGEFSIRIENNNCDLFAGRKVLMTKQKDNDPKWLVDWINLHHHFHGFNAVLLYENNSTKYTRGQLLAVLGEQTKVDVLVMLDWDYKFGPTGDFRNHLYSCFMDSAILPHSYQRFLAASEAFLCVDTDEVVLLDDKNGTLWQKLDAAPQGILGFGGRWIEHIAQPEHPLPGAMQKMDSAFFQGCIDVGECQTKVLARGGAYNLEDRISIHITMKRNKTFPFGDSRGIMMRHFRPVSTNWKSSRSNKRIGFNAERGHFVDTVLLERFAEFSQHNPGYRYPGKELADYLRDAGLMLHSPDEVPCLRRRSGYDRLLAFSQNERDGQFWRMWDFWHHVWEEPLRGRCHDCDTAIAFDLESGAVGRLLAGGIDKVYFFHTSNSILRRVIRDSKASGALGEGRLIPVRLHIPKNFRADELSVNRIISTIYSTVQGKSKKTFAVSGRHRLGLACICSTLTSDGSWLFVGDIFNTSARLEFLNASRMVEHAGEFSVFALDGQQNLAELRQLCFMPGTWESAVIPGEESGLRSRIRNTWKIGKKYYSKMRRAYKAIMSNCRERCQ